MHHAKKLITILKTSKQWLYRAVNNFSSRRGIVKKSQGTEKVWCYMYSCRLLLRGVGGGGYGGG